MGLIAYDRRHGYRGPLAHVDMPAPVTGGADHERLRGLLAAHGIVPGQVLLDPYARVIGRDVRWHRSLFGFAPGSNGDGPADPTDSAPFAPLGAVADDEDDLIHVRGGVEGRPGVRDDRPPGDFEPEFVHVRAHALAHTSGDDDCSVHRLQVEG